MTEKNNYLAIKNYAKSEEIVQIFRGIVGDDHAEGYIYSVIVAVSASPQLQQCTPQSIMRSAARAATLGLSCDPALGQAHLVPYKSEATLIPGWRGIRDMAYRTGQVAKINVGFLGEGQEWVEDQLTGDAHIEGMPKGNKPIGYFAYLKTFAGREHSLYMSNDEITAHKEKYAQGYDRARSAWNTDFHKMAKKTVLSQLLKAWATLDPTGGTVANLEYAAESIDEMPDPELVTIIEPSEARSNNQILAELGCEPETKEQEMPVDTSGPGDWSEFWSNVKEGNYPGVTEEVAGDFVKATNSSLAEVWKLTKQHMAEYKLEAQQEALL